MNSKMSIKGFILVVIITILAIPLFGQQGDYVTRVKLKDGSILEGKLIEYVDGITSSRSNKVRSRISNIPPALLQKSTLSKKPVYIIIPIWDCFRDSSLQAIQ